MSNSLDLISLWMVDNLDCGPLFDLLSKAQVLRADIPAGHPLTPSLNAFIAEASAHLENYQAEVDGLTAKSCDYGTLQLSAKGFTLATFPMTADWQGAARELGALLTDNRVTTIPKMFQVIENHGGLPSR